MPMDFKPSPLADVVVEGKAGEWTLSFVRELRHPPHKVWAALTDPAQVGEWAPYTASRDLSEPGGVTLTMIDGETKEDLAAQVIQAAEPVLLEYTWGEDQLRWELAEIPGGTRLTLRHRMADRDWMPKVAAGWHLCLDVAEQLLDGHAVGPIRGSEAIEYGWQDLADGYQAKLTE